MLMLETLFLKGFLSGHENPLGPQDGQFRSAGEVLEKSLEAALNQCHPRKHTPRHVIITLPKMKDKERILKAAREKETVTYKEMPIRQSADFSKETLQARRGWKEVFKVMKRQRPTSKLTLSSKAIIQNRREDKVLLR